ncbi:MAG: hypothetical protein WAZ14_00780 [Patescibacteria group bacterium]
MVRRKKPNRLQRLIEDLEKMIKTRSSVPLAINYAVLLAVAKMRQQRGFKRGRRTELADALKELLIQVREDKTTMLGPDAVFSLITPEVCQRDRDTMQIVAGHFLANVWPNGAKRKLMKQAIGEMKNDLREGTDDKVQNIATSTIFGRLSKILLAA